MMPAAFHKFFRIVLLSCFILLSVIPCNSQNQDSSIYNPKRGRNLAIGMGATYVAGMTGLYKLWYEGYPSTSFHRFDDKNEWKQMDKFGHTGSAYYISRWSSNLVKWTGASTKKSDITGTGISFVFLTSIEVFDAYSANWGFSVSDMIANTSGCALYLGQQLAWKEQRITMKFSYSPTDYADYRPDALGSTFGERVFKDYNGQTYWLSFNIYSFLNEESKFPKWLNLAVGYGADGMVTAYEQVFEIDRVIFPEDERVRQFYISPDIDLNRIKWKSGFMKQFSNVIGFIKFPLPAVSWDDHGFCKVLPIGF